MKTLIVATVIAAMTVLPMIDDANASSRSRASFMTTTPGGSLALVDASTIELAQRRKRVMLPSNKCISITPRESVFVYVNHYFPSHVGEAGFFVARVVADKSGEQVLVHAWRNNGWLRLSDGADLSDFSLARSTNGLLKILQDLYTRFVYGDDSANLAKQVNAVLGGEFHAQRKGTNINSGTEAYLFKEEVGSAGKVWHYLIAFTGTAVVFNEESRRPIFFFNTLPGIDRYDVEVVPNSHFAGTVHKMTVRIGKGCDDAH